MQGLQQPLVDASRWIQGDLQDVGHRIPIAGQREPRLLIGRERRLVVHGGDDIVQARIVPLDAVRRLHRTSERHAAQRPHPTPRLRIHVARKLVAQLPDQSQNLTLDRLQLRGAVDEAHDRTILSFARGRRE